MIEADENTTTVVVGGGVAGLALGNLLLRHGIECVVLERCHRDHVEQRQRSGALDGRSVRMLREWGLGEVVDDSTPVSAAAAGSPLRVDGEPRAWAVNDEAEEGVFCPQQVLVRNLIRTFLRDGGDLRFQAEDVRIEDATGDHPRVRYHDPDGATRVLGCELIAGCDGDRGVSRESIPAEARTTYALEHGYAWLAVLADTPADPPAVMAIHSRGFAARITRGPQASRFYLQCPLTDTPEHWPDERIRSELTARFGTPVDTGRITDKRLVPLRSVVHEPMSHGRLHLLGDAAHIVSPMSAKGVSLALHDAAAFARAVIAQVRHGDGKPLAEYSATCLRHTWQQQVSAVRITQLMHDAGNPDYAGEFRRRLARAELESALAASGAADSSP